MENKVCETAKVPEAKVSEMKLVEEEIECLRADLSDLAVLSDNMVETIVGFSAPRDCSEERKCGETRFAEMKDRLRMDCNNGSLQTIRSNIQKVIDITKIE